VHFRFPLGERDREEYAGKPAIDISPPISRKRVVDEAGRPTVALDLARDPRVAEYRVDRVGIVKRANLDQVRQPFAESSKISAASLCATSCVVAVAVSNAPLLVAPTGAPQLKASVFTT
jgi:hypothetical protein